MSHPVIQIEGISKKYRLQHRDQYGTLRDNLGSLFKKKKSTTADFWALQDVSFTVQQGERVGIIGRNGAGKSTLLKILSQITSPSSGRIRMQGRLASLLEVGTGFHAELTGRENIFLNGAILGMKRLEIKKKFDEIVDFAEIGEFLDTPVKRYSSGMYVRLAFAVAAHLEPDILVVDEVLAVGDAQFQKKCLGKMEAAGKEGRTVLFVSHNLNAIKSLCSSGVYLRRGRTTGIQPIETTIGEYMGDLDSGHQHQLPLHKDELSIHGFSVEQLQSPGLEFSGEGAIRVAIDFEIHKVVEQFRIGFYIKSLVGDIVFRSLLADWNPKYERLQPGRYRIQNEIPKKLLSAGSYVLELHASRFGLRDYGIGDQLQTKFSITAPENYNQAHLGEEPFGVIVPQADWEISHV